MLWTLVVLLAGACSAELRVRCSDEPRSSVSVTESPNGVAGRYIVEYCTAADPTVTKWQLVMSTLRQSQQNCTYDILEEQHSGVSHSHSEEEIDLRNSTCPRVCFSKSMDLMFRSCYRLENLLFRGMMTSEPFNTYYYADNNITSYYRDSTQFVMDIDYDTKVAFHWFEGLIPITEYEITVWPNNTHSEETSVVTQNCSRLEKALRCELYLPLGCYILQLKHVAPWTKGYSDLQFHDIPFCHRGAGVAIVERGERAAWYWWAAAALLLVLTAAGALLAFRLIALADTNLRKIVQDTWIKTAGDPEKTVVPAAGGRILLLYARDCEPAARLVQALRDLLQLAAPGQVYDLYSPGVTALAGRAPAAWLRSALLAADTRVVLLQSPALAALMHTTNDKPDSPTLEAPLLASGSRSVPVYSRPQFADTQLQFALQLLGEVSHTQPHPPYRKYFLATVSDLPVDMFPTVVPYTRYELPAASAALVNALRPAASASETVIADIALAASALVKYASENPNYLADLFL